MFVIYTSILLLIIVLGILHRVKDIKVIRVCGLEIIRLLLLSLVVLVIIGEAILPMPEYYIKRKGKELNLNEVLEEETLKAEIRFDKGSFKVIESYGMHFNHLFLCSYEIDGKEEVRFYHFEKNIFGNMKLKNPLSEANLITAKSNRVDYYNSYVADGIFAGYLVTVGLGNESSEPINYVLNKYGIAETPQEGYFMWVDMASQPWKPDWVKLVLYAGINYILLKYLKKEKEPLKFYSKWEKGDKIFICTKNGSQQL